MNIYFGYKVDPSNRSLLVFFGHGIEKQPNVKAIIPARAVPLTREEIKVQSIDGDLVTLLANLINQKMGDLPTTMKSLIVLGDVNLGTPGGEPCDFFFDGTFEDKIQGDVSIRKILYSSNEGVVQAAQKKDQTHMNTTLLHTGPNIVKQIQLALVPNGAEPQAESSNRMRP